MGVKAYGYLGDETHQVAFMIWARIVKYLIGRNPKLKIVIAGKEWAGFSKVNFKSEFEGSPSLPAARYGTTGCARCAPLIQVP
jgi:hypothetical protein